MSNQTMLLGRWAPSKYNEYRKCPLKVYKQRLEPRLVGGVSTPPTNDAAIRGVEVHKAAEDYLRGNRPDLACILGQYYYEEFMRARHLVKHTDHAIEDRWYFQHAPRETFWVPVTSADDAHIVCVMDLVLFKGTNALIVDYKTGKYEHKMMPHGLQAEAYAHAVFSKYPHIETVDVEVWYLEHPTHRMLKRSYTRNGRYRGAWILNKAIESWLSIKEKDIYPTKSRGVCANCPYQETCIEQPIL